jgi:biotin carboxyl carrier protein
MRRRFRISVDGRDYQVVVEEITEEPGELYPDRHTMTAAAAQSASVATPAAAPAGAPPPAAREGDVVSPVAGIILSIDVAVGAVVEPETRVATLEAMKTKTIVAAGRSGTVSAITVSEGQGVEAGQPLLTIS